MPAKRQSIRTPETRNHYKENTNKKSVSRGRVGGVGCFGGPLDPSTIYIDSSIATQVGTTQTWYLNGNTFISTAQTLIIKPGQQLRLNNVTVKPPQYYTLTNNGTINLLANTTGNPNVVPASINTSGAPPNSPPSLSNPSGTIICNSQTNLQLNGMINGGTITINGGNIFSTIGKFTNNGIININKWSSFFFSNSFSNGLFGTINNKGNINIGTVAYYGSSGAVNNGTLTNQNGGTITNQNGGNITIGNPAGSGNAAGNGAFINQLGGTVTNNGTITKVPGLSTFTNNGTYIGPQPVTQPV